MPGAQKYTCTAVRALPPACRRSAISRRPRQRPRGRVYGLDDGLRALDGGLQAYVRAPTIAASGFPARAGVKACGEAGMAKGGLGRGAEGGGGRGRGSWRPSSSFGDYAGLIIGEFLLIRLLDMMGRMSQSRPKADGIGLGREAALIWKPSHALAVRRKGPTMADIQAATSLDAHYQKSNFFRVIHADGVFGGPSPRGLINMAFYSERIPYPRQTRIPFVDGVPGAEEMVETKTGLLRELVVNIVMDIAVAASFHACSDRRLQTPRSN